MSQLIVENCPRCGLTLQPENRLIIESCGHKKCKQCFIADATKCIQCFTKSPTPPSSPISTRNTKTTKIETTNDSTAIGTRKHSQIAKAEHIKVHILETGEKKYECTVCSKRFKSRSQIYYHISCGKGGIKKYKCTHCDKAFSSKSHLCYHLISHKKESHMCAQCGKKFSNILLLSKHQKLHNNAGQRCTECGKLYRNSLSLSAHKAQHHNIYNRSSNTNHCDMSVFKCNLCEKEYYQKSTLRQHMLKHYGKRFECQVCKKFFQRNSTLQRHLKRHGQRTESFVCTECFRNFSDIGSLLRHAKIHKGYMQYKCRHCQITSVRRDNMLRHVRNIHSGEKFQECVEEINFNENEIKTDKTRSTATSILEIKNKSDENYDIIEEVPKTVANSSVIKFVGNVEPMRIPAATEPTVLIPSTILPPLTEKQDFNDPAVTYSSIATVAHKKFKKKYDPIEMYRKILISDDDDDNNNIDDCKNAAQSISNMEASRIDINETPLVKAVATDAVTTVQRNKYSETIHWRKNFKYTYEYRE